MKKKSRPKYLLGKIISAGNDTITIMEIYPPGHRYATKKQFGYLIRSWAWGENDLLESHLTRLIQRSRIFYKRLKKGDPPLSFSTRYGRFHKALETEDFIYYVDHKESDPNGYTAMYRKNDGSLAGNNYFATNDLYEVLCDSTFTKISKTMRYNYNEIQKEINADDI